MRIDDNRRTTPQNVRYCEHIDWLFFKHLVKITPLRVPKDLSKDIDPKDCFIKETGEFCHISNIGPLKGKLEEDAKLTKPKMDGNNLLKESRRRWEMGWEVKMK